MLDAGSKNYFGGGYKSGYKAQEELCRRTSLSFITKLTNNNLYDIEYNGIYVPNILVLREDKYKNYEFLKNPFVINIGIIAADNLKSENEINDDKIQNYKKMFFNLFSMSKENGCKNIILVPIGCGAFKNPPKVIAKIITDLLFEDGWINFFDNVVMSIIEDHNSNNNIGKFKEIFDKYPNFVDNIIGKNYQQNLDRLELKLKLKKEEYYYYDTFKIKKKDTIEKKNFCKVVEYTKNFNFIDDKRVKNTGTKNRIEEYMMNIYSDTKLIIENKDIYILNKQYIINTEFINNIQPIKYITYRNIKGDNIEPFIPNNLDRTKIDKNKFIFIISDYLHIANILSKNGLNPLVVDAGSRDKFGGGYQKGSSAQEEDLCRRTTLTFIKKLSDDSFYKDKLYKNIKLDNTGANYGLKEDSGIYVPNVLVLKDTETNKFKCIKPFEISVGIIAVNRYSEKDNDENGQKNKVWFKLGENYLKIYTHELKQQYLRMFSTIFEMAYKNNHKSIVLIAIGCGVFNNDPNFIADIIYNLLFIIGWITKFEYVVMVLLDKKDIPTSTYTIFKNKFEENKQFIKTFTENLTEFENYIKKK